jgi:hypothetical protein
MAIMDLNSLSSLVGLVTGLFTLGSFGLKAVTFIQQRRAAQQLSPQRASSVSSASVPPLAAPPPTPAFPPQPVPSAYPSTPAHQHGARLIPHPWIFATSFYILVLFAIPFFGGMIYGTSYQYDRDTPQIVQVLFGIAVFAFIPVWIAVLVTAVRLRRWGWLVAALVAPVFGWVSFGLFAPNTSRVASPVPVRG